MGCGRSTNIWATVVVSTTMQMNIVLTVGDSILTSIDDFQMTAALIHGPHGHIVHRNVPCYIFIIYNK